MQGIDQINKGLSFTIEMREQIASKGQDIQTPLNINVIIRRKVESKREGEERRGEKRRGRKVRNELSVKKAYTKKKPRVHVELRAFVKWRRPTLPRVCSTIGAVGLNFSVRNGKRWNPVAITTGNIV